MFRAEAMRFKVRIFGSVFPVRIYMIRDTNKRAGKDSSSTEDGDKLAS